MCSNQRRIAPVFYLGREHLRLISDPVRQRILELLCHREMSATELKAAIEGAPSNLHYHVDRLREAGLIRLQRTEPRRGATEKYYRAVALAFTLAPELVALAPVGRSLDEDVLSVVRGILESTYRTLVRSLQEGLVGEGEGSVVPVVNSCRIRASRARVDELRQRLIDWLEDCQEAQEDEGEVEFATLSLMFPVELEGVADRSSGPADDE